MSGTEKRDKEMSDLIRYMSGEMTDRERNAFEKKMQRDPFIADAAEGLGLVTPAEAAEDIATLKRKIAAGGLGLVTPAEAAEDIATLKRKIAARGRRRSFYLYSGAAAAIFLLVVSSVWLSRSAGRQEMDSIAATERSAVLTDSAGGTIALTVPPAEKKEAREVPVKEETLKGKLLQEEPAFRKEQERSKSVADKIAEAGVTEADIKGLRDTIALKMAATGGLTQLRDVTVAEVTLIPDRDFVARMAAESSAVTKALQGRVSGLVISTEDSMPIPGATIMIKGSMQGAVAGLDGRFSIPVTHDTSMILVASFIGMETTEMRVKGQEPHRITMRPDNQTLDEVVVVGYSGAKKTVETVYSEPEPAEGYSVFHDYIRENITYPEGVEGRSREVVVLDLPVSSQGIMGEPVVIRSPDPLFTEAAVKLIKEGPSWNPAIMNGKKIDDKVRIRLVFRKQNHD